MTDDERMTAIAEAILIIARKLRPGSMGCPEQTRLDDIARDLFHDKAARAQVASEP
jgi:hypothetical protein